MRDAMCDVKDLEDVRNFRNFDSVRNLLEIRGNDLEISKKYRLFISRKACISGVLCG